MYMHVLCLSLIFSCFQYGTVEDPYRLLQLRVCVRVCAKMMTNEVFRNRSSDIDSPVG